MNADNDDAETGEQPRDTDVEAFGRLYEQYVQRIHDYLLRVTRDLALSDDLTQDTFVLAFQRRGTLRDPQKVRSWLFSIAHNVAMTHLARRPPTEEHDLTTLVTLGTSPEARAAAQESAELVWAAARSLEPRQYEVLDLTVRQELTSPELAEVLGVAPGHASVLVHRAREALGNAVRYLLVARRRSHCARLAELVPAGVSELSADMRASVDHHMRRCPDCRDMAATLTAPAAILGGLAVVAAPHLLDQVHRQALSARLTAAHA